MYFVGIDQVVFPLLQTDKHFVKTLYWAWGTPKQIFPQKSQIIFGYYYSIFSGLWCIREGKKRITKYRFDTKYYVYMI